MKKEIDNKVQVLEVCDNDKDFQIKLLKDVISHQEERINGLENKITQLQASAIKQNIVVIGLVEEKDETLEQLIGKVKDFIQNKLEIEDEIPLLDVFRRRQKGVRDRPVIIKLQHFVDKAKIFANASKLKGKQNVRKRLFFVRDDRQRNDKKKLAT